MKSNTNQAAWVWTVCGVLLLASALNYMDRQTLSNLSPRIIEAFSLSKAEYGLLEVVFGLAFAVGSIAFGMLADRVNIRWLYPAVLVAWSVVGFATGLVRGYGELLACRLLLGFFEAGHWPCALKTTQRLVPADRRTLGNSVLQSGTAIGAILTPLIIKLMLTDDKESWRTSFLWIGGIGIGWVGIWFALIRGDELAPIKDSHAGDPQVSFLAMLRSRGFVTVAIMGLAITIAWQLFRAWLPLFLKEGRGYSESDMLDFNFAYHIATDAGCLTAGFATACLFRIGYSATMARKLTTAACAALAGIAILIPWIPSGPALFAAMLLVGAGLLGIHPCFYAFSQELSARHQGKVTGIMNLMIWVISSPFHYLFGAFIDRTKNYDLAFALAASLPIIGALVICALWPRESARAQA